MSINDFGEVQDALWEAKTKWHNIGVQLKLTTSDLDAIDADERSVGEKLSSVIKTRLNREPCTWRDLYDALTHPTVDMKAVAEKLTARLPSGGFLIVGCPGNFLSVPSSLEKISLDLPQMCV